MVSILLTALLRSLRTAEALAAQGFANVMSVAGGTARWIAEGLPVAMPEGEIDGDFAERYSRHLRLPQVGIDGQRTGRRVDGVRDSLRLKRIGDRRLVAEALGRQAEAEHGLELAHGLDGGERVGHHHAPVGRALERGHELHGHERVEAEIGLEARGGGDLRGGGGSG